MLDWLIKAGEKETYEQFQKAVLYGISQEATRFFEDDGPTKYGFEKREGQLEMAYDILDALIQNRHIAVEAGVGIGKSYAYLLPMLYYSECMGRPVVIATSTIALQEQLLGDVERLQTLLGFRREVILAKGQTHYLCRKRADCYLNTPEAEMALDLRVNIALGCEERKSFPCQIPQKVWERICVTEYGKHDCDHCQNRCLYSRIRERLKRTKGIILCNQDFLTAHLIKRSQHQPGLLSPLVEIAVVDEAHNLESKVRGALTERLSYAALYRALDTLTDGRGEWQIRSITTDTQKAAFAFFQCLYRQIREQGGDVERYFFDADPTALSLLGQLSRQVSRLTERVRDLASSEAVPAADALDGYSRMLKGLLGQMEKKLVWMERTPEGTELACCPKEIPQEVRRLYFSGRMRTILTSATLTNTAQGTLEEQYGCFIRNTGFPAGADGVLAEPKPSPFPYDRHAKLYCCNDLPHPTREREAFIRRGVSRLVEILNISHGKALVLFTAKEDLEEVDTLLRQQNLPYTILKQQRGPSQDRVREIFEADTDSVLLATGTYWEGISIEGRSLSNVVIFRLPFPLPDPIMECKIAAAREPLTEVLVPEMTIRLKQGVGRLIRNFTDTGIVSIIDPRLRNRPATLYRDTVLSALPIQNRTASLRELRRFYQSLQIR